MTSKTDLKPLIIEVLVGIAPEAQGNQLDHARSFRDQFDFDSVDFLSFVTALEKKLDLKVPEIDFPRLSSLDGCVEYFEGRLSQE